MAVTEPSDIAVIDFRRQSMLLQWHAAAGTWTACDVPPALVHGIALIRPSQPNICLFARDGRLIFQAGKVQFPLSESSPRMTSNRGFASFGLRRRFRIEADSGAELFSHSYWIGGGADFFSWIAARTADAGWRTANGVRWSEGLQPAILRSS